MRTHPTPRGLKTAGKRLWSAVMQDFELDETAAATLREAAFTADLLADLRAKLADTPLVIDSSQGPRVHPLVVEIRQQRLALTKLISAIGLPKELADVEDGG